MQHGRDMAVRYSFANSTQKFSDDAVHMTEEDLRTSHVIDVWDCATFDSDLMDELISKRHRY
jgi:hypothetical protein